MHSELQDNGSNHSGTINPLTVSFSKLIYLCVTLLVVNGAKDKVRS